MFTLFYGGGGGSLVFFYNLGGAIKIVDLLYKTFSVDSVKFVKTIKI